MVLVVFVGMEDQMPPLDVLLNLAGNWGDRFLGLPGALPAILLSLVGITMGVLLAGRSVVLKILLIAGLAGWMIAIGSEDVGLAAATFTIFEALRSPDHQYLKKHLAAVEGKVNVLHNTVEPFIDALDRRSQQIDLWRSERPLQPETITSPSGESPS